MTTATFVVDGLNLVTNAGHFDIDHSVVDIERLNLTLFIDGMRGSQDSRKHPWLPARCNNDPRESTKKDTHRENTQKSHSQKKNPWEWI